MGISFTHLILFAVIVGVVFGPKPFKRLGTSTGDFMRNLKRGWEGKHDIDITDSAKRLPPNED